MRKFHYNGERIGLSGYREMLEGDFRAIPDLYFDIHLLISEPPRVASRLSFDCTPKGILFGLHVNGKRVSFTENVFYEFRDETDRESMVGHRQGRNRISALVRKLRLFSTLRRNVSRAFALRRTFARTFWDQNKC